MNSNSYTETVFKKRELIILFVALFLLGFFMYLEFKLVHFLGLSSNTTNLLIFAIININVLLVLLVSFLILRNIVKFFFEEKQNILGARLRNRLIIAFVTLSLITTTLLFFVSAHFLMTSLDSWFNKKVENALEKSIDIGRSYLKSKNTGLKNISLGIYVEISKKCKKNNEFDTKCIGDFIFSIFGEKGIGYDDDNFFKIDTIQIAGENNATILSYKWKKDMELPPIPGETLVKSLKTTDVFYNSISGEDTLIRYVIPLKKNENDLFGYLVAGQIIPKEKMASLDAIRLGFEEYKQLLLYKKPIKGTLLLILALITLLILFIAIWFGIKIAKGITEPLKLLSEGTKRVALGDLDFHLESRGRDEIYHLINAFNTMTQDLREARIRAEEANRKLQKSYAELDKKIRYNEILLKNVAAGVISIDERGIITTINQSAQEILKINEEQAVGRHYSLLMARDDIEKFEMIKKELLKTPFGTIQKPVTTTVGTKQISLFVKFTHLKDNSGKDLGIVIVFDDLTEMEKIQKIVAWREVARRVAHEVKNPLTPIQLSAQRIRKKYMENAGDFREVLLRCTDTIITQVEELRILVNEFSNFAKLPAPDFMYFDINELIKEVWIMYRESFTNIEFKIDVTDNLPLFYGDPSQIRRVILNLLDNAVESIADKGIIEILLTTDADSKNIILTILDTGRGIEEKYAERIFEPYFSRKKDGTGLGLAIVKNIISDHNGEIKLDTDYKAGTRFVVVIPLKG
jgi:two-component system nitrogen regulation sensor histidine kinase NtrY